MINWPLKRLIYVHNSYRQVAPTGLININDRYPYKQVSSYGAVNLIPAY